MKNEPEIARLRGQLAVHLLWLHELTRTRNRLVQRAAERPTPALARALRVNRETADVVRRAARIARARLSELEGISEPPRSTPTDAVRDPPRENVHRFLCLNPTRARCTSPRTGNRAGMDADDEARELLRSIRAHIDSLPEGERLNALLKFVSVMLDYLTREQVLAIRAEMVESFGEKNLTEALNLLDGHLALRELQQGN
jgi:hypothetical protein